MIAGKTIVNAWGLLYLFLFIGCSTDNQNYTVEFENGVQIIHNAAPLWSQNPQVTLTLVRTTGELNGTSGNDQFYLPSDVARDQQDNMYVLDQGNHRIQKFDSNGNFVSTIGRGGQGPGEFSWPISLDVDDTGTLFVIDNAKLRLMLLQPDGTEIYSFPIDIRKDRVRVLNQGELVLTSHSFSMKTLEKYREKKGSNSLVSVFDNRGNLIREFGDFIDERDEGAAVGANFFTLATSPTGELFLSFRSENRIEKYDRIGNLIFRTDRPLGIALSKTIYNQTTRGFAVSGATKVSSGIGVDHRGRIWVLTYNREPIIGEGVNTTTSMLNGTMTLEVKGDTDNLITDLYKFDIFDGNGVFLGEVPLNHFCDLIRIYGDTIYVLDSYRGMRVFEYRITDLTN